MNYLTASPIKDYSTNTKMEIPYDDLKNDEITKKLEKLEMHTEGPGIWREN